jgi:tetratricopeptide (TPR) repeat protein
VAFAQVTKGHGLVVFYRNLLSRYLESEQDVSTKGLLCYNLANSIRRIDYHEALNLYFQATRFAPFYRKMSYWWEEVGGVLYLTGHYFFAERFYKKARKISQNKCREDIGILIADCQICQGKIKEALSEESVYCESHKSISSSCHLKILITKIMDERCIQVFDPKYWFNLGVSRSSKGNFKESMNCFLIAWRLCDSDVEALINSFVESYNCGDNSMAALILPVIKNLFPEKGYKMIVSTLLSNSNGNPNVGAFIDALKLYFFSEE